MVEVLLTLPWSDLLRFAKTFQSLVCLRLLVNVSRESMQWICSKHTTKKREKHGPDYIWLMCIFTGRGKKILKRLCVGSFTHPCDGMVCEHKSLLDTPRRGGEGYATVGRGAY